MKSSTQLEHNYGFEDMLRLARQVWLYLGNRHEKIVGWRSKSKVDGCTIYAFSARVGDSERENAVVITFRESSRYRARVDNGTIVLDYYGCMNEFLEGAEEFDFRRKMVIAINGQMQACARNEQETAEIESMLGRKKVGPLLRLFGLERPSVTIVATRKLTAEAMEVLRLVHCYMFPLFDHPEIRVSLAEVETAIHRILAKDFRKAPNREAVLWNIEFMLEIIDHEKNKSGKLGTGTISSHA
jgi:hypothetical protein